MDFQMVVRVLADAGKAMAYRDAVRPQLPCQTGPRQHQDLRRLYGTCRQNQLGVAMSLLFCAVSDKGFAGDASAVHQQAGDMRAG